MNDLNPIFVQPNINDVQAIEAHKHAILSAFSSTFQSIEAALVDALPKAHSFFQLMEGAVDLAVHAPNTRYLVKQYLAKQKLDSSDEDFELQKVSNCGLCIQTPLGAIRILKSTSNGMPKALSDARVKFTSRNQMVFTFSPEEKQKQVLSLNLFVLWTMDRDYKYTGMEIACPRRTEDDGTIDCYWITKWRGAATAAPVITTISTGADLDEIKPIAVKEKKTGNE